MKGKVGRSGAVTRTSRARSAPRPVLSSALAGVTMPRSSRGSATRPLLRPLFGAPALLQILREGWRDGWMDGWMDSDIKLLWRPGPCRTSSTQPGT